MNMDEIEVVSPIQIIEAVGFVDFFGVGFFIPLLTIYIRKIGGSHIHVGLLRSIYSTFQLASAPIIGSLSDLKGRKPVLMTTLVISSICYILMGLPTSILNILIIRGILGIVKHTQMLTKAMVVDYELDKQKQRKIFGTLMAVSGAGMTIGPVLGGYVEETFPVYGFPFTAIAVGICFLFNAGLISLLPCPRRRTWCETNSHIEPGNIIEIFFRSLHQTFLALYDIDWSQYGDIFIFRSLYGFAMGVYYSMYAAFLNEHFKLTPKYIGGIITFQSIISSISCCFICSINSFYTYDKDYSTRMFHAFLLLSSAYLGLILATNVVFYIFWLIPLSIGNSVCRLITLEMLLNRTPGFHRGKLLGVSNSVTSFSGVVSPLIAGIIGEWLGVNYVIYASLLATSLGVMLSLHNIQKRGRACHQCQSYLD